MPMMDLMVGGVALDLAPDAYRLDLRATADTKQLYEDALRNAARELAAAAERHAEHLRLHQADVRAMTAERDRAGAALAAASAAENELIASAPADRRQRYTAAVAAFDRADARRREIAGQVERLGAVLKRQLPDETKTTLNGFGGEVPSLAARQLEADQERARHRIAALQQELDALNIGRLRADVRAAETALAQP